MIIVTEDQGFFYTDWQAMTVIDWVGLIITVIIFVAFLVLFYWVFRPKNKQRLESHRRMVLDEKQRDSEQDDD
mgnify:CR=1 FL=1